MRESRYFKIMYYLLDRKMVKAAELAKEFGVSTRTIYRDIDALSEAGVPVYAAPGRDGGIYLMRDFVLDKEVLSADENRDVLEVFRDLSTAQYDNNNETLQRISGLFAVNYNSWMDIDISKLGGKKDENEKFELLKSAVIQRQCVKILYIDSNGVFSEKIMHPLRLAYQSGRWYLKAYCREKQDYGIYKISCMLDLWVLDEKFPADAYPERRKRASGKYSKIVLRFPDKMASRIYEIFDKKDVKRQEDGSFIVSVEMPEDALLITILLSFGPHVEIIAPVHIKEAVAKQALLIYEKNKAQ